MVDMVSLSYRRMQEDDCKIRKTNITTNGKIA